MPFKSQKQEAYMFAKHPDIAQKWAQEHPKNATTMMKLGASQTPKPPKAPGMGAGFSPWMKLK